jgi:hypothetical protein
LSKGSLADNYFRDCLGKVKSEHFINSFAKEVVIQIANEVITVYFHTAILFQKLARAFDHIVVSEHNHVGLEIFVVEGTEEKIGLALPPWLRNYETGMNDIWVNDEEDIKILHQPEKGTLIMLNLETRQAIYWVISGEKIPYYESSAPLRPILHWWMSSKGAQLIHAAAVGLKDAGVLLVGKGGSGKSNTAISCLNAPLYYIGDDYCLLTLDDQPKAYSLYHTGKLYENDSPSYHFLSEFSQSECTLGVKGEKSLYFFYPRFKENIIQSVPIKAIIVPKVANLIKPVIKPISAAKAYLAVAPSSIFQLHGARKESHQHIVKLLKKVPGYSMELSSNREENTNAIYEFLVSRITKH